MKYFVICFVVVFFCFVFICLFGGRGGESGCAAETILTIKSNDFIVMGPLK